MSGLLRNSNHRTGVRGSLAACVVLALCSGAATGAEDGFTKHVEPVLDKYCIGCHSGAGAKGKIDFEAEGVSGDIEVWSKALRMLRAGMMPPKGKPRPTAEQLGNV